MALAPVVIAGFGLLLAGAVKGATGLGYASCALPFLVLALGLKPAMGLVILPAIATNISLAFATAHFRETVTRFRWMYVTMLPGIGVGIWLLLWVSQLLAVRFLGLIIVAYAVLALSRPGLSLPSYLEAPLQWPTGFLNGVVTGLTGAQVMPLFPYVMALQMDSDRTVQAINLAVMIASTVLAIGLVGTGILTPPLFAASVAAVVPALIGVQLGNRARQIVPVAQFRKIALLTLLLIGILMLWR